MGFGIFNGEWVEGGLLLILLLTHARIDHESGAIGSRGSGRRERNACGNEKRKQMNIQGGCDAARIRTWNDGIW